MKVLLIVSTIVLATVSAYAQHSDVLKCRCKSGSIISISFKERFASIEVNHDSLVQNAYKELRLFMKDMHKIHLISRIYPLYVISPQNKYFTYPLSRNKLVKD